MYIILPAYNTLPVFISKKKKKGYNIIIIIVRSSPVFATRVSSKVINQFQAGAGCMGGEPLGIPEWGPYIPVQKLQRCWWAAKGTDNYCLDIKPAAPGLLTE